MFFSEVVTMVTMMPEYNIATGVSNTDWRSVKLNLLETKTYNQLATRRILSSRLKGNVCFNHYKVWLELADLKVKG